MKFRPKHDDTYFSYIDPLLLCTQPSYLRNKHIDIPLHDRLLALESLGAKSVRQILSDFTVLRMITLENNSRLNIWPHVKRSLEEGRMSLSGVAVYIFPTLDRCEGQFVGRDTDDVALEGG